MYCWLAYLHCCLYSCIFDFCKIIQIGYSKMNKYRLIPAYEDDYYCVCLKCKERSLIGNADSYKYCPRCGTQFDGEFTKRNPRYKLPELPKEYELDHNGDFVCCHKPRLIIEERKLLT